MKNNIINTKEFAEKLINEFNKYHEICNENGLLPRFEFSGTLVYFTQENEEGILELNEVAFEKLDKNPFTKDIMFQVYERELRELATAKEDVGYRAHFNLINLLSENPIEVSKWQSTKDVIEILHSLAENDDFYEPYVIDDLREELKELNRDAYNFYHVLGYETASEVEFNIESMHELSIDCFAY